jgi:hypothetical protein
VRQILCEFYVPCIHLPHTLVFFYSEQAPRQIFLFQDSVYAGLSSLYPDDFTSDISFPEHSGKLKVLTCLLNDLHEHCPKEKIVLVSNHTKVIM